MNDRTDAARSQSSHRSIRIHVAAGLATVLLLVAGVGGWAMTTELSGAVVAQGVLVVDSSVKKVQHPSGGVVGELRVRDGAIMASSDAIRVVVHGRGGHASEPHACIDPVPIAAHVVSASAWVRDRQTAPSHSLALGRENSFKKN